MIIFYILTNNRCVGNINIADLFDRNQMCVKMWVYNVYIMKENMDLEYLHIRIPVREVPTPNLNNGDNRRACENSS